ncbi:MAG TPA: hypothetical protein VNJ70_07860 [Thermoanaerobaculia bacterium]|nr:hypothetical protein [Thermoanaerobaculia bacterium]
MPKPKETAPLPPDQLKVNAIQAKRLASLSRQSEKELAGLKHSDLIDRLRWHLEPHLLLFRKICGRVVKKDPVTGVEYPVPQATVHVQDTDCGLVAYSPAGSKYAWYYPIFCRRETLATVKTDECGNFCVWVPRWDIDWILRWRKERFCFPFIRPSILDILDDIPVLIEDFPPRPPRPEPELDLGRVLARVSRLTGSLLTDALGPALAGRIAPLAARASVGSSAAEASATLADTVSLHPPLPDEFKQVEVAYEEKGDERQGGERHTMDMVRSTLAQRLGIDAARLAEFDLRNVIGPFKRCVTFYVPEWTVVFDVPDITFRVTQDVDGDGDEEVIYSEGFFDVRWDAGTIPPVKLVASGLARESRICGEDPPVRCGTVPDIQFAGMMPLTAPYVGGVSGYGRRPNRPKPLPPPLIRPEATAPFCDNVNLFGCLIRAGATHYRLVYKYSADGGSTFSPEVPFTGHEWWWHPVGGPPVHTTADGAGWYALPPAGLAGPEVNFLFPFDTTRHADGIYEIRLQMGTGGSSVTASSSPVRLRVDNSPPDYTYSINWRIVGATPWIPLAFPCPVVSRGVTPQPVEFDVRWDVWATHYRDASIGTGDCGSGSFGAPVIQGDSTASGGTSDWHQGPLDNSVVFHARYVLPAGAAQGTYNFGMSANSRAFNPAGADANYQALDWFHDSPVGGRHTPVAIYFSVINA